MTMDSITMDTIGTRQGKHFLEVILEGEPLVDGMSPLKCPQLEVKNVETKGNENIEQIVDRTFCVGTNFDSSHPKEAVSRPEVEVEDGDDENDSGIAREEEHLDGDLSEEEEKMWKEWITQSAGECGTRFIRRSITSLECEEVVHGKDEYSSPSPLHPPASVNGNSIDGEKGDNIGNEDEDWYVKGEDGEWIKWQNDEWNDGRKTLVQNLISGSSSDDEEKEGEEPFDAETQHFDPSSSQCNDVHEYERSLSSDSWTSSTSTTLSMDSSDLDGEERNRIRKSSFLSEGRRIEKRCSSRRRRSRSISWGTAETVEFLPFPREEMEKIEAKESSSFLCNDYVKEPSNVWILSIGFLFTGSLICYRVYCSHLYLFHGQEDGQEQSSTSDTYSYKF